MQAPAALSKTRIIHLPCNKRNLMLGIPSSMSNEMLKVDLSVLAVCQVNVNVVILFSNSSQLGKIGTDRSHRD